MVRRLFNFNRKNNYNDNDHNKENNSSSPQNVPLDARPQISSFDEDDNITEAEEQETKPSSSIFSKGRSTYHTSNSSDFSSAFHSQKNTHTKLQTSSSTHFGDVGKPLKVLQTHRLDSLNIVPEEEPEIILPDVTRSSTTGHTEPTQFVEPSFDSQAKAIAIPQQSQPQTLNHATSTKDYQSVTDRSNIDAVKKELHILETNLSDLMDDIHQNVTNISKAVIESIEFFKDFTLNFDELKLPKTYKFNFQNNYSLRVITKIVLHFIDNLLISDGLSNSRSILLRRYMYFLKKLDISILSNDETTNDTDYFTTINNLNSSNMSSHPLPHMTNFCITEESNFPSTIKIGEIMNKLTRTNSSTISEQEGSFIAPILRGLSKNSAILTIMFGIPNLKQDHLEMVKVLYSLFPDVHFYCCKDYIKPCADILNLQQEQNISSSSTTTNHLFDNIPPSSVSQSRYQFSPPYRVAPNPLQPPISMSISRDENTKITGTLGGYIFPQIDESNAKLSKFAGSTFAITCAHVVLSESQEFPNVSIPSTILQTAYKTTLINEANKYPKNSKEQVAFIEEASHVERNIEWQKNNKFGQVVWGERSIIDQKLSDFAIIKVDGKYHCENTIGIDPKSIPDPTLRFQNTLVKKKILKVKSGLKVFKIGSSSNFTTGQINGAKIVYWADGKLQSSEFIVSSPSPMFATAGDSGAWILTKLEDHVGLGVVGMLHSYDGEQKQFGLFTPISNIMERLNTVTGIQWDIDRPVK
ncbi:Ssy5p NDAI_0B00150 [Naumovozyma dairenensis CBS 421]|uniref:SPS-sensor serine protease component SSY5 n=1 Tax=Naumovozyma dairenensis (strain ATCC 10597 / BCRC 20456 / CBS 421 / NBRC 0211 / NRRL Y-12639) TaxID=1071378 RepID=G0W5I8_NAUDC|nr:hypothetical protein NDAI_0B00150 [Naumovozyma dairenensis CBS 421]CCD23049.1 hypothetical protein NDAI_0B00150 [Naumovozyma dairenensis CBS 421]